MTHPYLPGDPNKAESLARALRVNHAGEYGAKRIYEGQLAVLKHHPCGATISHMAEQEAKHLSYFEKELSTRRIRPSLLSPLWHIAGFALGAGTALLGTKAAMACTVAVEEVIDEHYHAQLETLPDSEAELKEKIRTFQAEEVEHKDIALAHDAEEAPAYALLTGAIKIGSRLAIWIASRV